MGLLNVYNFSKTIKPHLGFRFKVTFFYNKGAEEIESLSYYVKSVELPVWNINTENRQRFGNTQYVIPTFDFGQSTLKIVFLENDNMNVTYFLNGFLFNNVENAHRDANLWNNCAPAILKIKIDELDYSMRNTVVSNIYACHLKRLSTPNFSNTSYGNPVEIEAEFVVRYKLNSLATEVESGASRVIEEPNNFNEMVINARDTEKQNKEMMDASRKTAALNAEIYSKHNLLSNAQIDEIRNKIDGVDAPSAENKEQLDLINQRNELLQANADIRNSDMSNEEKLKLIEENQQILSAIDHELAEKNNINLPADEVKGMESSTSKTGPITAGGALKDKLSGQAQLEYLDYVAKLKEKDKNFDENKDAFIFYDMASNTKYAVQNGEVVKAYTAYTATGDSANTSGEAGEGVYTIMEQNANNKHGTRKKKAQEGLKAFGLDEAQISEEVASGKYKSVRDAIKGHGISETELKAYEKKNNIKGEQSHWDYLNYSNYSKNLIDEGNDNGKRESGNIGIHSHVNYKQDDKKVQEYEAKKAAGTNTAEDDLNIRKYLSSKKATEGCSVMSSEDNAWEAQFIKKNGKVYQINGNGTTSSNRSNDTAVASRVAGSTKTRNA